MGGPESSGNDKLDEILKETRSGNRIAIWQLVAILVSALPGVIAGVVQSAPTILLVAFALPIVVVVLLVAVYASDSKGSGAWRDRIEAQERARVIYHIGLYQLGTPVYHDTYVFALRVHHQLALVEGKKELADYLKSELDKEEGTPSTKTASEEPSPAQTS